MYNKQKIVQRGLPFPGGGILFNTHFVEKRRNGMKKKLLSILLVLSLMLALVPAAFAADEV